jgi:hypothetical protein
MGIVDCKDSTERSTGESGSPGHKSKNASKGAGGTDAGAVFSKTYYTQAVTYCQGENRCAQDFFFDVLETSFLRCRMI